jgi:hypothetical protein
VYTLIVEFGLAVPVMATVVLVVTLAVAGLAPAVTLPAKLLAEAGVYLKYPCSALALSLPAASVDVTAIPAESPAKLVNGTVRFHAPVALAVAVTVAAVQVTPPSVVVYTLTVESASAVPVRA